MAVLGTKKEKEVETVAMEPSVKVNYPYKFGDEPGVFGRASVVVEGTPVFINGMVLYDGTEEKNPYIKCPRHSYKDKNTGDTKWANSAGPASKETRQAFYDAMVACYTAMAEGQDVGDKFEHEGVTITYPRLNPFNNNERALLSCNVATELPIFINRITARTRDDGTHYVNYPQRSYEKNGERRYVAIAGPSSPDTNKLISEAVIEAISNA